MNMTVLTEQAIESLALIDEVPVSAIKNQLKNNNNYTFNKIHKLVCLAMAKEIAGK